MDVYFLSESEEKKAEIREFLQLEPACSLFMVD